MRIATFQFGSKLSVSCVAFASLLGAAAWGQATTGSVSGHVVDSSGGAVPFAKVVITDVDKKIDTVSSTNSEGDFTQTALPPDHYRLTVSVAGFSTSEISVFKLDIDQRARFDIVVKPGATDTVTVTDSAPALQLQGAETGQVIGTRAIEDLPTKGRDFTDLLLLVPGVVRGTGSNNLSISVNGQREFSNSFQINGVEVSGLNNDTNVRPSPDSIQEFKVLTSDYAPEFGRSSAGAVIIQTKSGTNNLHGSAFIFYRPTSTAASDWSPTPGPPPTLNQKNYGGSLGGPVRKDKAFLFAGYEGFRNDSSYAGYTPTLVGQNQVMYRSNGDVDLSGLKDPYTGNLVPIFDPYATQNYYASYVQQFPGNVIPAAEVSPAGRLIVQKLFPAPQNANPYLNFTNTVFTGQHNDVGNLRADYTFSQNNRFYVTYDVQSGLTYSTDPYAGAIAIGGGGGADTGGVTSYQNHSFAVTFDHTFSPNLLNETRATYFISPVKQSGLLDGTRLADKFGIQNANITGFPTTYGFPQIFIGNGAVTGGSTYKPLNSRENILGLYDSITYTRGRHNIKFGYEYRNIKSRSNYSLFPTPFEYFAGAGSNLTSDPTYCEYQYFTCNLLPNGFYDPSAYYPTGGAEIADVLLGLPQYVFQGLQLHNPETRANEHTGYAQDYWQVTPKLNLTFGLRYEYVQPYVETNDDQANFDLNTLQINVAGRGGNSRSLVNSNQTNLMPRVGIAYQLNSTTVLRGGFGIFYSPENDSRDIILTENYPFYTEQYFYNDFYAPGDFTFQLDKGAARSTTIQIPATGSINLTTVPGANLLVVNSEPKNFPTANSKNYNVTLQQEIARNTTIDLSFVGANTRDLSYKVGNYNVNSHLSKALGQVQALESVGISNYSSLQAKLNRQFAHGYGVLVSYTWSHSLDNGPAPRALGRGGDYPQNPFNIASEYGRSDTDLRNVLVGSQVIELPFGRGRHFLTNLNRAADVLVGGWQLNSITTLQSGKPFNIVVNANDPNLPGLRPNLTSNPYPSHRTVNQWINPAAFTKNLVGATVLPGNLQRNSLVGPGYTDEELSLFKSLSLPREMKFQMRIEAFNVLNTAHYGQPDNNLAQPGTFGKITGNGGSARVMQFGGRLVF